MNPVDSSNASALIGAPVRPARWAWATPHARYRLYLAIAGLLFVAAYLALAGKALRNGEPVDLLINDAPGYYAYLPSVLLDHDLDFRNQVWNQFQGEAQKIGPSYLKPRWPIGVAITLVPPFLAAHGVSRVLYATTGSGYFLPNGYSVLYQPICCAYVLLLAFVTMVLADRLLTERFRISGTATFLAVVSYWLGTHYLWYCFREPFMAHIVSGFWVAAVVYIIHRLLRKLEEGQLSGGMLLLLAWCTSMALVCRLTNAVLFPLFLYLLYAIFRAKAGGRFFKWLPIALIGLLPLLLQAGSWYAIKGDATPGSVQQVGYEKQEGFLYWNQPRLWQTLFSSRHGLMFWAPLLVLSALGVGLYLIKGPPGDGAELKDRDAPGRRDPLLIGLILAALLLWYLNSAWGAWWFGSAVGGRAFLGMTILFLLGLGFCYEFARRGGLFWRRLTFAAAILGIAVAWGLMLLRMANRIPKDGFIFEQKSSLVVEG